MVTKLCSKKAIIKIPRNSIGDIKANRGNDVSTRNVDIAMKNGCQHP